MPPHANPNPDRGRRGANAAATTAMVARAAAAGEEEEPTAASPAAIVAQPAPAAATRTVYGQIRSTHRSRMHHGTADKLVYMHEALHLEAKLHDAGWEPDIERHESDTDSQASDDEVDFRKGGSLSKEKVLALCM